MKLLATARILAISYGKGLYARNLHVPAVVEAEWLRKHHADVKILDASFSAMKPKQDHKTFLATNYGQFEKLMKEKVHQDYISGHIPGAVHFNLDVASYPGKYARFGLYPPKIFEKYMQLLGLNNHDPIVLYGRGPAAGMLFAARAWWTLKIYGHQAVSVLNGGFDAWLDIGGKVSTEPVKAERGGWIAHQPLDESLLVDFDELTSSENGKPLLDRLDKAYRTLAANDKFQVNFLDARVADQFTGRIPLGIPAKHATGSHIKDSKNIPITTVVGEKGMKSKNEILDALKMAGYDSTKPTYISCNKAIQASLVSLALEHADLSGKVYNGSFEELAQRASHYINA